MFNIRNIVKQITDRSRDSDPESPGKRSQEDANLKNAEGFLCPKCMKQFSSPCELQAHYTSTHDDDALLLEAGVDAVSGSLGSLTLSQGGKEQDFQEQDGKINREVLNLPSAESIENITFNTDVADLQHQLQQAVSRKAVLETRVVQLVQSNVSLKSKVDELDHELNILRERHKVVEAQLAHRESIDDAAVLRQELVQVQRVMDEMNRERERERDALQAELQLLQTQEQSSKDLGELKISLSEKDAECTSLKEQIENCKKECERLISDLTEAQRMNVHHQDEILKLKHKEEQSSKSIQETIRKLEEELAEANVHLKDSLEKKQNLLCTLEASNAEVQMFKQDIQNKNCAYEKISSQLVTSEKRIEELSQEVNTHSQTISRLERERSELLVKIQEGEGISTAVEQLESSLQSLTREHELLKNKNVQLKHCITKGEGELASKTAEIKTVSQQKHDLEGKLEEVLKAVADRDNALSIKEKEKDELKVKLRTESKSCAELTKENEHLKEETLRLQEEVQNIEQMKLQVETNVGVLQQALEDLKREYSGLQEEHQKEVNKLNAEIQEKSNESLVESLTREREVLINEGVQLKLCIAEREKELASKAVEIKTLSQQKHDLGEQLEEIVKVVAERDNALRIKEKQEEELKVKLGKEMESCTELTKENVKLKEEKICLQKEVQNFQQKKLQVETNLGVLQQALEDLKHEYCSLQEEHQQEIEKLNAALQEKSNLLQKQKNAVQLLMVERAELGQKLENAEYSHVQEMDEINLKLNKFQQDFEDKKHALEELKSTLDAELGKSNSLQEELNKVNEILNETIRTKSEEMKVLQASFDELTGEKLALEAQLETTNTEQQKILERCYAATNEADVLQRTVMELRRKLDESEAALQELGRENATLQLDIEKLLGRKWAEDADVSKCTLCYRDFTMLQRKHHCRNCGQIFCNECSSKTAPVVSNKKPVRVCDVCYNELVSK